MGSTPNCHLGLSLLLLHLLVAVSATLSPAPSGNSSTVYDILPEFGLPSGLLPSTVTDYTLSDDGSFVVHLSQECYVEFDYLVYYEKTISGKLSYGSIKELNGIQVQRFFFWFDVDEIKVDLPPSDSIYFQVGLINKKLDVSQFKTIHSCRDLLSCGRGRPWKGILEIPKSVDEEKKVADDCNL